MATCWLGGRERTVPRAGRRPLVLEVCNGWIFLHKNGREQETLSFEPHLSMNDFSGLAPALVAGTGIGDLPPIVQPKLIEEGRLVEV